MQIRAIAIALISVALGHEALSWGASDLPGDVAALVKNRCVKCHGPAKQEGGLNLSYPGGIALGGENGSAVVAAKLEQSLLWKRVAADEMPEDRPLSADEKQTLRQWIERGAAGLPERAAAQRGAADHWAFRPLADAATLATQTHRSTNSAAEHASRQRTEIDRLAATKLHAHQLNFAADAERHALLRRASLVLTGLPPSPEEIAGFVNDTSVDAYERLVDRLLASPGYAERWARHWLDAAGYADSNGYFNADSDRPLAYKYRDYVIRSLGDDKPFDAFVMEQIAGDQLAAYDETKPATPPQVELLTATHFLRNGQDGTGESDGNAEEVLADKYAVLEGSLQIIGSSLLGLTLQCTRCHDHKFEPVTQRDYYQLQAILYPALNVDHWVKPNERVIQAATEEQLAAWRKAGEPIERQLDALKDQLAAAKKTKVEPGLDAESQKQVKESLDKVRKELQEAVNELKSRLPEKPGRISVLRDLAPALPQVHLLERGVYKTRGAEVLPAPPAVLCSAGNAFDVASLASDVKGQTGTRLAFARWLTKADSPSAALLARVTVNRQWQHLFAVGIAPTPENLGLSGALPAQRELIEYLARRFVDDGWSLKALHRRVSTSTVFRQSSAVSPNVLAADPDNVLLSRYPLRRLDADAIRDAMLTASGELNASRFGPYIATQATGVGEVVVDENSAGAYRRGVYLQQRRTQMPSMSTVFDAPSVVVNCTRRSSTTIPLQSLSLLNSDFVRRRASALADRTTREAGGDALARAARAYSLVLNRAATAEELSAVREFIAAQAADYVGRKDAEQAAWVDWCQTLLASNGAIYVE